MKNVNGLRNCITEGCFHAILGGDGNTIPSLLHYAGVFGCNVSAVYDKTLHVNCLNARDTPNFSALHPTGTIFKCPVGAILPPGALPLYWMP